MGNFDEQLKEILSEDDQSFIRDSLEEEGYYASMFDSFKGKGRWLYMMTWVGIFIFCGILFYAMWKFFQAETVRDQIMYATLTMLANMAQIALKLWYNMRLNRRDILRELRKTRLAIANAQT